MHRFTDKTAVVTGAAGGIGRAIALGLAAEGATLLLADLDEVDLARAAEEAPAAGAAASVLSGDLSNDDAVEALISAARERLGRIDCLFINAGIQGTLAPLQQYPVAEFDRVMAVNARSVFLCLHHGLGPMVERGAGAVVVTCSVAALGGLPGLSGYVASKHAALGLVRSAAQEVAPHGVRVNAICPGATATGMLDAVVTATGSADSEAARARFAASSPMKRIAAASEIANAALYLASDAAAFVTGAAMAVDGGLSSRMGGTAARG